MLPTNDIITNMRRKVTVRAYWGNDDAEAALKLAPGTWRKICGGDQVDLSTWGYYEGRRQRVLVRFNHPERGDLYIGGDDGADHLFGSIADAHIEGAEFPPKSGSATIFEVLEGGTLRLAGIEPPRSRGDAYGIRSSDLRNRDDLLQAGDECEPFRWFLREEYERAREELVNALETLDHSQPRQSRKRPQLMACLDRMPSDPDEGLGGWLESVPLKQLRQIIRDARSWLQDEPDWTSEEDYLPQTSTGEGAALDFFRNWNSDDLEAVGIEIVEGEHPGSSYFAAELTGDVRRANLAAFARDLSVWFVRVGE